jgi:hypothetical protein
MPTQPGFGRAFFCLKETIMSHNNDNAVWTQDGTELIAYKNDRLPRALSQALYARRIERLENMRRMLDGLNPADLLCHGVRYEFI